MDSALGFAAYMNEVSLKKSTRTQEDFLRPELSTPRTQQKKTSYIIWYCAKFLVILQRKGDERITYLHDEGEGSYTTVYLFYHARGNVFPRAW